ncbi:Holliday junction resolvase RuvX [bacterium]|jgi:putative Holliday junction resolvase|nr:Holliday junction resolvase RuvX [bacterium]
MKFLGVDFGHKRVGLAVSDDLNITAQGLGFVHFTDIDQFINHLAQLIENKGITSIVIGNPVNMSGKDSPGSRKVKDLAEKINKELNINVNLWDERLTTVSAQRILISANITRKKRKEKVDSLAAQIMLQNFLDHLENSRQM